ncbi:hypothetical protein B4168_0262 [Anoxybacillus flavithermus]|nr:hypothetical protein B4168_0262 [Anoxybacillus flavithermus]OAO88824.1 hypothetical protein GT23_0064 [Parageobacillus thermoglucosidasius]
MIAHHLGKESLFIFYIPGICGQRQKKVVGGVSRFLEARTPLPQHFPNRQAST